MQLKKIGIHDISELQEVYVNAYVPVFADHWTENGMEFYLERESNTERLKSDVKDADYEYYFIQKNGKNIGFIKTKDKSSDLFPELDNCELEKIYILPEYSGMGIGKMALTEVIDRARLKGKKLLFLSVIDTNKNAVAFYKKLGFEFHSKTRLEEPNFKEELRGMDRMKIKL